MIVQDPFTVYRLLIKAYMNFITKLFGEAEQQKKLTEGTVIVLGLLLKKDRFSKTQFTNMVFIFLRLNTSDSFQVWKNEKHKKHCREIARDDGVDWATIA